MDNREIEFRLAADAAAFQAEVAALDYDGALRRVMETLGFADRDTDRMTAICPACENVLSPDDRADNYCPRCKVFIPDIANAPGWGGSQGPATADEYRKPHVYARDIHSGAGNCVCGLDPGADRHIQIAPGVPVPERLRR